MAQSSSMIPDDEQTNYEVFRDCLSEPVLRILASPTTKAPKKRRAGRKNKRSTKAKDGDRKEEKEGGLEDEPNDAEDLADFINYLSTDIFTALPNSLRTLTHALYTRTPSLKTAYASPLPASALTSLTACIPVSTTDSLATYNLIPSPDPSDLQPFLAPVLVAYIAAQTTPPPPYSATRTDACELCERSWIPLTYHHLIPKSTHARVLKRGWHPEEKLNSVAWLCRACHSFVHRVAVNEELARSWYTAELLRGREDVQRWVEWVGRVRWKKR